MILYEEFNHYRQIFTDSRPRHQQAHQVCHFHDAAVARSQTGPAFRPAFSARAPSDPMRRLAFVEFRAADGKPNPSAPAPKMPDGKPDLSGIWRSASDKSLTNLAADGVQTPQNEPRRLSRQIHLIAGQHQTSTQTSVTLPDWAEFPGSVDSPGYPHWRPRTISGLCCSEQPPSRSRY